MLALSTECAYQIWKQINMTMVLIMFMTAYGYKNCVSSIGDCDFRLVSQQSGRAWA